MASEATLPAIHVLHVLEVVKRWKVSEEEILDGFGIAPASLTLPGLKLPFRVVADIVERARLLTKERALGIYVGLEMKVSWHGFAGFAAMSAETVGDALELASKFAPIRTSAIELELTRDREIASLLIHEKADLGSARDVLLFAMVVGLAQIGSNLLGRPANGRVEFSIPEPDYFAPFRKTFAANVEFSRPVTRLNFEASTLAIPMPLADAGSLALARRQCEAQLEAISQESDIVATIRNHIGTLDRKEIAKKLGMSTRTLKRRLAEAGTTFSEIASVKMSSDAMSLLKSNRSIDEVAEQLGYSDRQSFSRAFRRWTGMTPSAYRKSNT